MGDDDFIFSAQKIFVKYLRNTKKENFKNVMFLE
jgi:ribosomal protein L27